MSEDAVSLPPQSPTQAAGSTRDNLDVDAELDAINRMVSALGALKEDQRLRAIEYVLRRFNAPALQGSPIAGSAQVGQVRMPGSPGRVDDSRVPASAEPQVTATDIRSLKESKVPKSAIEMATLVAYYLSEVAPPSEKKAEITKSDVERYFKMAGFKLPSQPTFTLNNAKNAGYLDSAGSGQFRMNAVGYNLVAHRMGTRDKESGSRGKARTSAKKKRLGRPRKAAQNRK